MDSEHGRSVEAAMTPSSKKKHWEYPWTVDEMRKAAGQWNLASDVGMLQHLQEFSQKLLSQTHEIQEQVDSLNHDAKLTNVRLHNVFNDFVMLANTQFVENRVYDEEVVGVEQTDGNKKLEEKEKTQEQKEMELIPKIKQAISLGLNVFDTAYEKLDMNIANSESEDEEAPNRANVYLEPKDPYLHRPLPCLIGSDQFFQLDNLGLGNLLVEDERDDQESDHLSDAEVGGPPVPKPPSLPERKLETDSDESDEDLFGVSKPKVVTQNDVNDEEEEEDEGKNAVNDDKSNTVKSPMSDLHSELSRKLGVDPSSSAGPPPKRQASVDKDGGAPSARPRASKSRTQQMEGDGDLFGNALDEPTDDIFSRPSRLFSSRPTLFDDDEDESGGLFGSQKSQSKQEKPLPPASAANKPVPVSAESDVRTSSVPQSKRDEISEEKPNNKGKGLFDAGGDDDDDGDLFAKKPTAAAKQSKETKKPAVSLFDDDEDEDDSDIFSSKNKSSVPANSKPAETENKPRLPAGAVSIFGGGDNLFKAAIQKANKTADDTDDVAGRSTISDKSLSKPSTVAKSLKPTPGSSTPSSTMSSSSLFAEDPELFTTTNKTKSSTADLTKESSQTKAKTGFSLFADEEDDDLFASLSKPAAPSGNKTAGKETEAKKKAKSFLFEDDDDDGDSGDLFALPKPSTAKDEKKNITLVDEVAPQKASTETKPAATKVAVKDPVKEPTKPNKVSLFSGSDDEDDLFSLKKSPAKIKTTTDTPPAEGGLARASGKRQSLFDDDNFLFNTKDDDGPSIDLFKPSAAKVETKSPQNVATSSAMPSASSETKSAPTQKPTPVAAPRGASTKLFGSLDDDDEDDLFSTLTTKSSEKKSKVSSKPTADETGVKGKPKNSLEDIFGERTTQKEKAVAGVKEANASVGKLFDDPLGSEAVAVKTGRKTPDVARLPASPILQPKGLSDDLFGDDKELKEDDPKSVQPLSPKSSTSPKVLPKTAAKGDRISKLQASIIIDPASHLPQKIKKIEQEKAESAAVDFSLPSQTPTLHSLAKDRVKIPTKRRPPTRKHAELHDSESHNGFGNETDAKEFVLGYNSTANVQPKLTSPAEREVIDKNSNRDLSGGKMDSGKTTLAASEPFSLGGKLPPVLLTDEDNEEDDLFGTSHKSKPVAIGARTAPISAKNDSSRETGATSELRQTSANTDPVTSKENPLTVKSGVDDRDRKETAAISKVKTSYDDDDIFAKRSSKAASTGQSMADTKRDKNAAAAADDDEDDLFGGKQLLSSSTQAPTSKTKTQEVKVPSSEKPPTSSARNDVDDDDLFGTKALKKPTAAAVTKRATGEERSAAKHLLSSDDDDIFNVPKNSSASSAAKTKPASNVKAAQDADDDDDIFANSSLAPKGARKTAGNNKPKVKEPVFDDDDDDIFASLPSSKVKKTVGPPQVKKEIAADEDDLFAASSSSRPVHKKLVTKDEDLFQDDTDIFANIPSARPKDKKPQGKSVLPTGTPLFTNEPDDIFAEASASAKPAKVTSDTQKPVSKAKPKEDYDDIFDDPLNALQK